MKNTSKKIKKMLINLHEFTLCDYYRFFTHGCVLIGIVWFSLLLFSSIQRLFPDNHVNQEVMVRIIINITIVAFLILLLFALFIILFLESANDLENDVDIDESNEEHENLHKEKALLTSTMPMNLLIEWPTYNPNELENTPVSEELAIAIIKKIISFEDEKSSNATYNRMHLSSLDSKNIKSTFFVYKDQIDKLQEWLMKLGITQEKIKQERSPICLPLINK